MIGLHYRLYSIGAHTLLYYKLRCEPVTVGLCMGAVERLPKLQLLSIQNPRKMQCIGLRLLLIHLTARARSVDSITSVNRVG